ncbi:hypothetical protein PYCH_02690 [Pyrococcus yayanosii CH1]|uniref:Uncharacterized protein n=2 Tax=Pyrococcus TaxID=2260 RepID=F8AGJ7_PYRYC|nr:hypothetical protein PYCH_02690 [Pyrococcus yayanosii CH1]
MSVDEETFRRDVLSRIPLRNEPPLPPDCLPIAKNERQRAHLELYNLREEIFEALFGRKDDLHYLPLERLKELVEKASGEVIESGTFEPALPQLSRLYPAGVPQGDKGRTKACRTFKAVG